MKKSHQEPLTLAVGRLLGRYVRHMILSDRARMNGLAADLSKRPEVRTSNVEPNFTFPTNKDSTAILEAPSFVGSAFATSPIRQIDAVLPIPSHWLKVVWRRGSSPEILAEQVAQQLNVPIDRRTLFRRRWTGKQGMLLPGERQKNVQHAFALRKSYSLRGLHLLLVDDILTSGATANEAARVLKQAGAAQVSVATVARGLGAHRGSHA